jgi:serine/threonine-protein kinase
VQLAKGLRLGPYEIIAPLAAGGMGEVYLGRDTRLGRDVAIKILGADVFDDPKLRARFEKEARAISSLNHPNICALYDVGQVSTDRGVSLPYIVMEYLEGETLENRLKKGPLPLANALRHATEIVDALDKAHRKHILHRDLKPSNIMLTKRGARLFDFGLAKFIRKSDSAQWASDDDSGQLTRSLSQITTPEKSLTAEGAVIGTLEYMAPEQLQGKEPDARTDIFSFGVCLYQMITGHRPFHGNSRASLIAAILDRDPAPVSQYGLSIPASVESLLKDCLSKDPEDRMQTAHDVMLELKRIAAEPRAVSASRTGKKSQAVWFGATVAGSIVVAALLFLALHKRTASVKTAVRRFSISLPQTAPLAEGPFEKLAVSPDGMRIAYVGGKDPTRLYVYSLDTLETKPLPGTEGAKGPFFSPRGDWVGFYTDDRELKKVAVAKGQPVLLSPVGNLRGATWGPDETIIFAEPMFPLHRVSASGGEVETLSTYGWQAQVRWPWFLPGGEYVLYTVNDLSGNYENAKLAVASLKSGQSQIIFNGATYGRYIPTGHLAYFHSQTIYAVPFDIHRIRVTGPPISLISDADSYFTTGLAHFTVSADGSLFYIPRSSLESERELVWVDRSGISTPITQLRRAYGQPKLSPDGKGLIVAIGALPRTDLWFCDIAADSWNRLTSDAINDSPIWSPDGTQIAFGSNRGGGFDLYVMASDGSSPPRRITARNKGDLPSAWSPDGKVVLISEQQRGTLSDILAVPLRWPTIPTPMVSSRFDEAGAVFSPDGHWIAYRSNESGRDEIYVQPYPPTGRKRLVSVDGGTNPVWSRDGQELFYRSGNRMMVVETQIGNELSVRKPRVLFKGEFEPEFDVTADRQRFVMVRRAAVSPGTRINVILGAFDQLK